jgi:uncharacterized protein (TIGR03437 family)
MIRTGFLAILGLSAIVLMPAGAQTISGGACSTADLNGQYAFTFTGRAVSAAGSLSGTFQSNGLAPFDGAGKVSFSVTANTNVAAGKALTYSGTYSVGTNCTGTVAITSGGGLTLNLVEWSGGNQVNLAGSDATYNYTGSASPNPGLCSTASLSGPYTYTASGSTLSGSTITGVGDESGMLQFDGAGNVSATYNSNLGGTAAGATATGTYSVNSTCVGSGTMTDTTGKTTALNFTLTNAASSAVNMLEAGSTFVRTGTAHSAFVNPDNAIGNVASYITDSTPAGSVFVLFGQDLASRGVSASTIPLPTILLNTQVTVNGEPAPLFYVDSGQIDAQIPWDIPGNTLANVVVKNGTALSNTAAVYIPATGAPGISVYGNNRAVVVNQNGTLNSGADTANVGDTVVVYFTGGGPVTPAGKLTTGAPAPNGLSPITGASSVAVNGVNAKVNYIGLTPQSIGLCQANFVVPSLPKGTYPVMITIAGVGSNNPVMTVGN